MTRIILVTGSRALVGSTCESLARDLLSSVLRREPATTILVLGDAEGPDEWARELTMPGSTHEHPQRIWALDGWIHDERGARSSQWSCGHESERDEHPKRWPLLRNRLMVRSCARRARAGDEVEVIALEAAWSSTHGTAQTIAQARDHGLRVTTIRFERG